LKYRKGVRVALIAASIGLTIVGAALKFNLGPVPYTMQNMGIMFAGMMLEARYAALALFAYLILIALGLPVAAGFRGGIHVLLGYTAGYLWAFPLAAALISMIRRAYLARVGRDVYDITVKDAACLIGLSFFGVLPMYLIGFAVFYLYASGALGSSYRGLMAWAYHVVNDFMGLHLANPVLVAFIASVAIFVPQDLLMDHAIAVAVARSVARYLRSRELAV